MNRAPNAQIVYQPTLLKDLMVSDTDGKKVSCIGDVLEVKHLDNILFFFSMIKR